MGLPAPPKYAPVLEDGEPIVQFDKELSAAAVGSIWLGRLARGLEVGRLVSVRRIGDELLTVQTRERLRQAARAVAELRHPTLVKLLGIREAGGEVLSISEYLQGVLLYDLRRFLFEIQTPMPMAVAVRVVRDAARAAAIVRRLADERGLFKGARLLYHDSIVVAVFGETLLRDIGVLTELGSAPAVLEQPGVIAGLSPEELFGPRVPHVSSEVFSLGTLLWELLANRPVFSRRDAQRATSSVISQPIPQLDRVERIGLPVPKGLVNLVARAIERDPRKRIPTLDAFADAIDEQLAHLTGSTDQVGNCMRRLAGSFLVETSQSSGWLIRMKSDEPASDLRSKDAQPSGSHNWEPETLAARTLLVSAGGELLPTSSPPPRMDTKDALGLDLTVEGMPLRRRSWAPVLLTLVAVAAVIAGLHRLGVVRSSITFHRGAEGATDSSESAYRPTGAAAANAPKAALNQSTMSASSSRGGDASSQGRSQGAKIDDSARNIGVDDDPDTHGTGIRVTKGKAAARPRGTVPKASSGAKLPPDVAPEQHWGI